MTEDTLFSFAKELNFRHEIGVIPVNENKQPMVETVVDKRGRIATPEELDDYFGPIGSKKAQWLAVLLDSPCKMVAFDLDGTGLSTFQEKVVPRCSRELQNTVNMSMRTKTPQDGLHILFKIKRVEFPNGIHTREYWSDLGNGKRHNQINLMGDGYYLIERGPVYSENNGPESLVTMSKDDMQEMLNVLEQFEVETKTIRKLANILTDYYQPTNRDNLVFALSGYLYKNEVPKELCDNLVKHLIDIASDEEYAKRFQTIRDTYAKEENTDQVSGFTKLLEAVNGNHSVVNAINEEISLLGYSCYNRESSNGNTGTKKLTQPKQKSYLVYKYTKSDGLAEEIVLGDRSKFLQIIDGEPVVSDMIDLSKEKGITLKPHQRDTGQPPVMPIHYKDMEELKELIKQASSVDIGDLYFLVKSIWKNVVATREKELIVLLSADTIMSYFQDLFVTVHYVLISGPPGWGKGAILVTFKLLGYRVILAGDMSGANILDLLGSIERCQITIAEDELDNLEDDEDKQRIYKMGYEDIGLVTRTVDPSSSERTIRFYNPFGIKFFAGEKAPDSKQLGGFNDRTFRSEAKKGRPKLLIKTIKKQMEKPTERQLTKYKPIIARIDFLRKILLIKRLLHHNDTIPEVSLNIFGRPFELCGPTIQLFDSDKLNVKGDTKARDEIIKALSHFLRRKGELDKKTIEAVLYNVLKKLIEETDKGQTSVESCKGKTTVDSCKKITSLDLEGHSKISYIISYDEICTRFREEVEGTLISARTIESADFDRVTHDSLLSKCRNIFGGKYADIGSDKEKKKAIEFDKLSVDEAGGNFEVVSEIKILEGKEEVIIEDPKDAAMWKELALGVGAGSSFDFQKTENERFSIIIDRKTAQKEQAGTKGLIYAPNSVMRKSENNIEDEDLQNLQDSDINHENPIDRNSSVADNHDTDSGVGKCVIHPNEPKLDPKTPEPETNPSILRTTELLKNLREAEKARARKSEVAGHNPSQ